MVSALGSGSSGPGFELWPGSLCCVLAKDTSLDSKCLSPPRIINAWVPANC